MVPTPPAPSSTADDKLNYLMSAMTELLSLNTITQKKVIELEARTEVVETSVADLRREVTHLKTSMGAEISALKTELIAVKTTQNARDQQQRSLSIKLSGLPVTEDEKKSADPDKFLAKKIYDKLLKPILTAAKDNGHIESVPTLNNCISEVERMKIWSKPAPTIPGASASVKPPAIPIVIIRLTYADVRLAVLRNKKDNTPAPTQADKALGSIGFFLNEDLTPSTFKALRTLQSDDRVDKVWSVDGRLRFVLSGDSDRKVIKVKNVFDPISSIPT